MALQVYVHIGSCYPVHLTDSHHLSQQQWDPKYRIKVRVICARAYHALFMVRHLTYPLLAILGTRS